MGCPHVEGSEPMKCLVVNSDDFGMCHSVNLGVLRAFQEGILTQASVMVPCPWFEEAVTIAKEHGLPVGVHLTATCEWDVFRWRPLTGARSMVRDDGSLFDNTEQVRREADMGEVEAEFEAQIELIMARGIKPTHLDVHMTIVDVPMLARLCRKHGLLSRQEMPREYADAAFRFGTYPGHGAPYLSSMPAEEKKLALREYLSGLTDGVHFECVHAAVRSPEMESVCSQTSPARKWAQEYRASDLDVVTDPEMKALCRDRGIRLVSLREVRNDPTLR
jgi:predicted glycoside hydrolase/deacetylase ChbG (UPF0249 family)